MSRSPGPSPRCSVLSDNGIASHGARADPPAMIIGVPKEIKIGETRVSMTPSLCRRVVMLEGKVLVEKSAGLKAGFTDAEYQAAGATVVPLAAKVWKSADVILKVKEPLEVEYP